MIRVQAIRHSITKPQPCLSTINDALESVTIQHKTLTLKIILVLKVMLHKLKIILMVMLYQKKILRFYKFEKILSKQMKKRNCLYQIKVKTFSYVRLTINSLIRCYEVISSDFWKIYLYTKFPVNIFQSISKCH